MLGRSIVPPPKNTAVKEIVVVSQGDSDGAHRETITKLETAEKEIIDGKSIIVELQTQIREADRKASRLEEDLDQRVSRINYLEDRLRAEGIQVREDGGETGESSRQVKEAHKYYEKDAKKLQAAAARDDIISQRDCEQEE